MAKFTDNPITGQRYECDNRLKKQDPVDKALSYAFIAFIIMATVMSVWIGGMN
jgi:hypothetical protein